MTHVSVQGRAAPLSRGRIGIGWIALLVTAACNGVIGDTNPVGRNNSTATTGGATGSTGSSGATTGGPGGTIAEGDPNAAGILPLQRLTRREYNNTVRDLLGDDTHPGDQFPDDLDREFLFRRAGTVAQQDAELLRTAAETLAAKAVTKLSTLLPCDPQTGEDACARQFIGTFGQRAYRRPLADEETTSLTSLYTTARSTLKLDFPDAIGLLIESILQAPAFLYHWESPYQDVVQEGVVVRLDPYRVASRLSYFLWGSLPDKELFDAAAAGALASDADIEAQAQRMLSDVKAREGATAFFREWLELETLEGLPKDPGTYPDYNDALKTAMADETSAFVENVVFEGDSHFETLLDANFSFLNQALGGLYGVAGATGATLKQTNVDATQRQGLLTQPSFLALNGASNGSHPVKRGKAVYQKLLCGTLPPPPANVPAAKPPSAGGTTRERFTEHDQNPCAKGCHVLMDPIGFAFEHYDGIGRYRTMDNGGVVDSSGELEIDGSSQKFADAIGLAGILAKSDSVRACFATQWIRFGFGRTETDADLASIGHALAGFGKNQYSVRDLIVAVASSRSFRYRAPVAGEVLP